MAEFNENIIGLTLPINNDIPVNNDVPLSTQTITTCVVGIRTNIPYDSSKFTSNDTTFYTEFTYKQLSTFINLANGTTKNENENECSL